MKRQAQEFNVVFKIIVAETNGDCAENWQICDYFRRVLRAGHQSLNDM